MYIHIDKESDGLLLLSNEVLFYPSFPLYFKISVSCKHDFVSIRKLAMVFVLLTAQPALERLDFLMEISHKVSHMKISYMKWICGIETFSLTKLSYMK